MKMVMRRAMAMPAAMAGIATVVITMAMPVIMTRANIMVMTMVSARA